MGRRKPWCFLLPSQAGADHSGPCGNKLPSPGTTCVSDALEMTDENNVCRWDNNVWHLWLEGTFNRSACPCLSCNTAAQHVPLLCSVPISKIPALSFQFPMGTLLVSQDNTKDERAWWDERKLLLGAGFGEHWAHTALRPSQVFQLYKEIERSTPHMTPSPSHCKIVGLNLLGKKRVDQKPQVLKQTNKQTKSLRP